MATQELGRKIGTGANAEVYEFGPGKVIKLFKSLGHASGIHSEYNQTLAVWRAGLPVPQPFGIVEVNSLPGLVSEHIVGEPLVARMFRDETFGEMRLLARLLYRVHSVPEDKVLATGLRPVKGNLAWQAYNAPGLDDAGKRSAVHILADLPDGRCICHGDFHMLNVMMRGEEPVILDWQGASYGNPCYDIMQLCIILRYAVIAEGMLPQEAIESFYAHRAAMEQAFMGEYHRLSGISREEVEAWFAPCACSRLHSELHPEERVSVLAALRTAIHPDKSSNPYCSIFQSIL